MSADLAALVSNNLDIWTSAIERKSGAGRGGGRKISFYGIERLRALILDLAVRGNLVPQHAEDGGAAKLLDAIEAEKVRLFKTGAVKRMAPIKVPATWPFGVPESWAWSQIGTITNYGDTQKANPGEVDDDTWVLELEDVEKGSSRLLEKVQHSSRQFQSQKNRFRPGDVIYGKLRPYLDKVLIADEAGVCTTEMVPMRGYYAVEPAYLRWYLKSPFFIGYADSSTHGMNLPRVGTDKARAAPIALPPLAEQRRIVAKVDELMALCDVLEAQSASAREAHETLVETLLATLVDATDPAVLAHQWTRLEPQFDILFTTQKSIERLRLAILNLAMRGQLSHRSDWPSGPVKLGSVAGLQNGYAFKSEWFSDFGVRLLRNINIGHDNVDWSELACLSDDMAAEYSRFELNVGDVVLTLDRPFISTGTKVARIREADLPALLLQRVARFELSDKILPDFIYLWICSPMFSEQIDPGRSNGVPHISTKQVEAAAIFVPDVAEQRRVVAKVDELMALCDALVAGVADGEQTRKHLADAIVERVAA